jgi:hypothetical protein
MSSRYLYIFYFYRADRADDVTVEKTLQLSKSTYYYSDYLQMSTPFRYGYND